MTDKNVEGEGFVIRDMRGLNKEEGPQEVRTHQEPEPSPMEINFSTFVLSLVSSVMLCFGEMPDPVTGQKEKNLPMAKHTIDILALLQEKTRGNLSEDEAVLLEKMLTDLRLKYVNLVGKG